MRRILSAITRPEHLRVVLATSAVAWGLGVLASIHAEQDAALMELDAECHAAEARLARLMEAEEEQHQARRLGQVVPEQREGGAEA